MKIMTFNTQHCLNYIERRIDFDIMAKAINDQGADIVGLNEMRGQGLHPHYIEQVKKLSELTGLKYWYFAEAIRFDLGGVNPYGNGFLSRYPIISAETVMIPDPDPKTGKNYYETRCVLKAKLEGDITVLVSHFGLNDDEAENAVKTVVENLADEKCILMGDFNLTPDDKILKPIFERMKDTAELFTEPQFSFPSDMPDQKIDYIFVSRDIEVISAEIPPVVASDHRPHTATVNI